MKRDTAHVIIGAFALVSAMLYVSYYLDRNTCEAIPEETYASVTTGCIVRYHGEWIEADTYYERISK